MKIAKFGTINAYSEALVEVAHERKLRLYHYDHWFVVKPDGLFDWLFNIFRLDFDYVGQVVSEVILGDKIIIWCHDKHKEKATAIANDLSLRTDKEVIIGINNLYDVNFCPRGDVRKEVTKQRLPK